MEYSFPLLFNANNVHENEQVPLGKTCIMHLYELKLLNTHTHTDNTLSVAHAQSSGKVRLVALPCPHPQHGSTIPDLTGMILQPA